MKTLLTFFYDFSLLLKAEIKRDYIYMKRYPLEIISFIFFMYVILLAVFFGFSQLSAGITGVLNQEKMIIGYCLMQFVLSTQMGWSGQIQNESQTGTLEQLSISGHSLGEVLMGRGFAQLPRQIASFMLLIFMYRLSLPGLKISFEHVFHIILVLSILAVGIFGISYLFAGITLLFKRVGFFFQIINFAFLGLFWQERSKLADGGVLIWLYDNFPLTMGMTNMQKVLIQQTEPGIPELNLLNFAFNSVLFALLGYYIFLKMEKQARNEGLLSQY